MLQNYGKGNTGDKKLFDDFLDIIVDDYFIVLKDGKPIMYELQQMNGTEWQKYEKPQKNQNWKNDVHTNPKKFKIEEKELNKNNLRIVETIEWQVEENQNLELYEFPNMEYLSYLLHADPKNLNVVEKEFVKAFLKIEDSGAFSLEVQMYQSNDIKKYIHDNLITKRSDWNLKYDLKDEDIDILNILNDSSRINEFNNNFEKVYSSDLLRMELEKLVDEYQKYYSAKTKRYNKNQNQNINLDIRKKILEIHQECNKTEQENKNKISNPIIKNQGKIIDQTEVSWWKIGFGTVLMLLGIVMFASLFLAPGIVIPFLTNLLPISTFTAKITLAVVGFGLAVVGGMLSVPGIINNIMYKNSPGGGPAGLGSALNNEKESLSSKLQSVTNDQQILNSINQMTNIK